MARIDSFFKFMMEQKASDLHLSTGNPPMLRIHGDLVRIDAPPLESDDLKALVYEIAPETKIKAFEETGDVDFGYEFPGFARYRANFLNQKNGIAAVFRLIPSKVLTMEELGLPPVLKRFASLKKGLVLVTGPTGSGKSTTLAAMVDYANLHRKDHIITVEDPIEFVHRSQQSLVNQREVGVHTRSFASALRGALREDPDIILVGEMRDLETIELALTAAATGHLVFGTLHTSNAPKTIDRIIDVFPDQPAEPGPRRPQRVPQGRGRAEPLPARRPARPLRRARNPGLRRPYRQFDPRRQDPPDRRHDAGWQKEGQPAPGRRHHGSPPGRPHFPRGGL